MTIDGIVSYAQSLVDYICAATMVNIDCDWYVAKLATTKRSIAQHRSVLQRLRTELEETHEAALMADADDDITADADEDVLTIADSNDDVCSEDPTVIVMDDCDSVETMATPSTFKMFMELLKPDEYASIPLKYHELEILAAKNDSHADKYKSRMASILEMAQGHHDDIMTNPAYQKDTDGKKMTKKDIRYCALSHFNGAIEEYVDYTPDDDSAGRVPDLISIRGFP